jgi:hypothetical protein
MEEQKCNKSAAVDHIVAEYERRRKDDRIDEVAERVIERLGLGDIDAENSRLFRTLFILQNNINSQILNWFHPSYYP